MGARNLLVFDPSFQTTSDLRVLRALLTRVFSVPRSRGRKRQKERLEEPVRHTLSFAWLDGRIWLRTYRIGAAITGGDKIELEEIGPRLVLAPVRIIAGAFGGAIIHNLP